MSSWFKKIAQGINPLNNKSRWSFSVEADVWVPSQMNEEEEKETARKILETILKQVEGDASLHTAIDSSVMFEIQFEPLKR